MKNFLLIVILAFAVVLTWCSEKTSQEDLFEKKQECISYKDNLQNEINSDIERLEGMWYYSTQFIKEIFYSLKEDSCFAVTYKKSTSDDWNVFSDNKIINLLTNEEIIYDETISNKRDENRILEFNQKLKELKWE